MKKFFYLAFVLCMGLAVTSCNDDEEEGVELVVQTEEQMSAEQLTAMEGVEFVLAPQYSGADKKTVWEWQLDDETIGEGPVLRYTFAEEGTYVVYLTAINKSGSGVGYSYTITVKPAHMLDFEGDAWASLIPQGQAYGVATLIYGDDAKSYAWTDASTTLQGGLTLAWGGDYGFAEGGTVVSNYIDANIAEHATADYQLSVPVSNGSQNFAVVYCDASLKFKDDAAYVIKRMDICPTTYLLGEEKNGGYGKALTEVGDYMTLTITANNGQKIDIDLARDGVILDGWKTVDLSSLGEVKEISFSMDGSDQSSYGVKHPKYFAFDNVVVKMK